MIKRKWFGGIERNLSFLNEVSAGIGLVTGYVLFGLYWLSTPITTVEVTTQTVAYEERVIGYIPEPTKLEPTTDFSTLERTIPVIAKFPILNEQERPALSEQVVTFEGKGAPMIYVEQKEIVTPKLVSDEVKVVSPHKSNNDARFYLETILQGTGYYYEDKRVTFDGAMSADIFAVRIGTLFALLSLVLLMIKVRAIPRLAQFAKNLLAPDTTIGFLDEATLSEHYNDVEKFKKQYEIMKRAREAEFNEQIGVSPEVALANLTSFTNKADAYFKIEDQEDEYVLCRDDLMYIDPPIYCDLSSNERITYFGVTADPFEVKRFDWEEAVFFCDYLRTLEGNSNLEPMSMAKAIQKTLQRIGQRRNQIKFYLERKGKI